MIAYRSAVFTFAISLCYAVCSFLRVSKLSLKLWLTTHFRNLLRAKHTCNRRPPLAPFVHTHFLIVHKHQLVYFSFVFGFSGDERVPAAIGSSNIDWICSWLVASLKVFFKTLFIFTISGFQVIKKFFYLMSIQLH